MRRSSSSCSLDHALRNRAGVRIDLAFEERCQLLPGDVPLVQQDERGPARRAPPAHYAISSTETSTLSTSSPEVAATASATRSCTARATSGTGTPPTTESSNETAARPEPCETSTERFGRRTRAPPTRLRRLHDEALERSRRDGDRSLRPGQDERLGHEPASAGSRPPASARKPVE